MNAPFTLDKGNSKLMGVCAGISRQYEVDLTLTRVGVVLLTAALGPLTLIAYLAAGFIAPDA
jgi:phage shock protein C